MGLTSLLRRHRFLRFCIVATINASIDLTIFTTLRLENVSILYSNMCSTSLVLIVSFILNSRFTFNTKTLGKKKIAAYFLVALTKLWVVQPILIKVFMGVYLSTGFTAFVIMHTGHSKTITNLLPKITATTITLFWNYIWYSLFIFKHASPKKQIEPVKEALEEVS